MRHLLLSFLMLSVLFVPSFAWFDLDYETRYPILNSTFQGITYLGNVTNYYGVSNGTNLETIYLYNSTDTNERAVANDTTEYCFFDSITFAKDCPTPPTNLVSYWTLDDASGNIWDAISGHNGTVSGTPVYSQTGKINDGIVFDGTTDFFTIADHDDLDFGVGDDFTITLWFKSTDGGVYSELFEKQDGTPMYQCGIWDGAGQNNLQCDIRDTSSNLVSVAADWSDYEDGNWNFLTLVRDTVEDKLMIYMDGVSIANTSDSTTATLANGADLRLADGSNAGAPTSGTFDDFRIYNDALTATEISNLYISGCTTYFGELEQQTTFDFEVSPSSPHIEENVTFTCANCADHTKFYWDFDDGSDLLYLTSNSTVGNIYFGGGNYNVTLVATNSTDANETVYNTVTVTEPDIYIWLNDTLNDAFLSDFTLTVWNCTNTFNFSTSGAFVTWNYTSGPKGNISILPLKDGYNTTMESTYISNSTDLNYTASAFPAMLRIYPVDYDYRNVPVPIYLSLTNISTSLHDSVSYLLFDSATSSILNLAGSDTECSEYLVGQMFKYTLYAHAYASPDAGSYSNSSLILTDEDETVNITLNYVTCPDTDCEVSVTQFLFISKDGTYKILNEDASTNKTGTFSYFPGKIIGCSSTYIPSGASGSEVATTTLYKIQDSFNYYISDANMTLGAVNLLVSQETASSFGYLQNLYSPARRYFDITSTSNLNETVYMVPTTYSSTITMNVVDNNGNPINDAVVTIYKLFDSTLEIVGGAVTDSTGTVQFNERVGDTYYFSVVASEGTESGTILLISGGVTVSVRLSSVGELAPGVPSLAGVTVSFTPPPSQALYEDNCYWFNLTILDTNSYLNYSFLSVEYIDMNLSILNTSTSSAGVAFSNYICIPDLNTSNQIYLDYGFWHGINASVRGYYSFSEIYYVYEAAGLKNLVDMVPDLGAFKWILALLIIGIGYASGPIFGFGATLIAFILKLVELDILLISGMILVVTHLNSKEGL